MKTKTAKTISALLALLVLVFTGSAAAFAVCAETSEKCGDDLTWTLDSQGTLTVSGNGDMYDYSSYVNVPWHQSRKAIKKVVIENGVTSIGGNAFYECDGLLSVTILQSVRSVGKYAFCGCTALSSVTVPSEVTEIGEYAFGYYHHIEEECIYDKEYDAYGLRIIEEDRKIEGFKILCRAGSKGEEYAAGNGIDYEIIDANVSVSETPSTTEPRQSARITQPSVTPKTGDNGIYMLILVSGLSLAAMLVVKRIKEQ